MAQPTLFEKLGTLQYDLYNNGDSKTITNILKNVNVVDNFSVNPETHYEYIVKDGESAEIIADLYYDNSRYYWVILLMNNIKDVFDEWPLSSNQFLNLISQKYGGIDIAMNTPHSYVHKTNGTRITVKTYDFNKNDSVFAEQFVMYSYYDYEEEKNEKNRVIKLLRKSLLDKFVDEFERVVNL